MSDFRKAPPSPVGKDVRIWMNELYQFLADTSFEEDRVIPKPVFLPHQLPKEVYRATQDGIMMFDPINKKVVVSIDGVWQPL